MRFAFILICVLRTHHSTILQKVLQLAHSESCITLCCLQNYRIAYFAIILNQSHIFVCILFSATKRRNFANTEMSQFPGKMKLTTRQATQFRWLMTQENDILAADEDYSCISDTFSPSQHQPFTQIDFPSFTQLVADEEKVIKMPDPYKPPPEPKSPQELSELAWIVLQKLPHKDAILQDLLYIFENSKVEMGRTMQIGLFSPLTSEPFLKTFLGKCPLLLDGEFPSSQSSDVCSSSSSGDEISENEDHPFLLQEKTSPSTDSDLDISHDFEVSSSEDEAMDVQVVDELIDQEPIAVNDIEHTSPDLPEASQSQGKLCPNMPNLDCKSSVQTQTDLTMEDIERLLKRSRGYKESQVSLRQAGGKSSDQQTQQTKKRRKSIVRIGLPRVKSTKQKPSKQ